MLGLGGFGPWILLITLLPFQGIFPEKAETYLHPHALGQWGLATPRWDRGPILLPLIWAGFSDLLAMQGKQ